MIGALISITCISNIILISTKLLVQHQQYYRDVSTPIRKNFRSNCVRPASGSVPGTISETITSSSCFFSEFYLDKPQSNSKLSPSLSRAGRSHGHQYGTRAFFEQNIENFQRILEPLLLERLQKTSRLVTRNADSLIARRHET